MRNFVYWAPTKVIFGRGAELETAAQVKEFGGSRVLLVYGGGSVIRSGLLDKVKENLREHDLEVATFGGVTPNPRVSTVRKGIEEARAFDADFVIGIGGGSALDAAKAIAVGLCHPGHDIWAVWRNKTPLKGMVPVGAIVTIPAAGSEMSDCSVLTLDETGEKRGLNSNLLRCCFAITNPEYCATVPAFPLRCGVVDIMMHTIDRYFTTPTDNELTDEIAEGLLRTVIRNGRRVVADPGDYHSMSEIMWASSISHNGLTGLGGNKDFAPHNLSHSISGKYDVAHGAALSAIWPSWAKYCYKENPARFGRFGKQVWDLESSGDVERDALAAIGAFVDFFRSLEMPINFEELGIGHLDEETIQALADHASVNGTITLGAFKVLDREDMVAIYRMANGDDVS